MYYKKMPSVRLSRGSLYSSGIYCEWKYTRKCPPYRAINSSAGNFRQETQPEIEQNPGISEYKRVVKRSNHEKENKEI
jgi:hypothetical protein